MTRKSEGASVAVLIAVVLGVSHAAEAGEQERVQEAERLKSAAFEHFAGGNYERGISAMEAAYGLVSHPDFLFDIAIAYQKWGQRCEETHRAFRRFLDACGA